MDFRHWSDWAGPSPWRRVLVVLVAAFLLASWFADLLDRARDTPDNIRSLISVLADTSLAGWAILALGLACLLVATYDAWLPMLRANPDASIPPAVPRASSRVSDAKAETEPSTTIEYGIYGQRAANPFPAGAYVGRRYTNSEATILLDAVRDITNLVDTRILHLDLPTALCRRHITEMGRDLPWAQQIANLGFDAAITRFEAASLAIKNCQDRLQETIERVGSLSGDLYRVVGNSALTAMADALDAYAWQLRTVQREAPDMLARVNMLAELLNRVAEQGQQAFINHFVWRARIKERLASADDIIRKSLI